MELTKDRREEIAGRKTPTWRDSNATSASERDFHSPLLVPPLSVLRRDLRDRSTTLADS